MHLWLRGSATYRCKDMGPGRKEFMAIFSIYANWQCEQAWASLVGNEGQVKTWGNSLCILQTAFHVNEAMPDHPAARSIHRILEGNINGGCFKSLRLGWFTIQLWKVALWLCCYLSLGFLGNRLWDEDLNGEFSWDSLWGQSEMGLVRGRIWILM